MVGWICQVVVDAEEDDILLGGKIGGATVSRGSVVAVLGSGARQCRVAACLLFSDRGRDSVAWHGDVDLVALLTTMLECSTASPAEGVDNLCCRTCWAECCMCMSLSPLVVVLVAGLSELAVVELGALHGYACCDVRDGAWGDAESCACGDAGGGACGDAEGGARGDAEGGA